MDKVDGGGDVLSYVELFEAGIELVEDDDGPEEREDLRFGKYLVEEGLLSPFELDEVIGEQARQPGVRLSEVIAWMGYMPYAEVDRHLTEWRAIPTLEVEGD